MLKLTSKYNQKTDACSVKADCKNTCTYEHLYAVVHLIENILKNDPTTDYDEIKRILDLKFEKEEKTNGKRNSKPKAEV